jgi:hypothetical protein
MLLAGISLLDAAVARWFLTFLAPSKEASYHAAAALRLLLPATAQALGH